MTRQKTLLLTLSTLALTTTSSANWKQQKQAKADFEAASVEYGESYFRFLYFKNLAPGQIAKVKSSMATTGKAYRSAKSVYDRELKYYDTLNNELSAIPSKLADLAALKENSINTIPTLKMNAKTSGLFEPSEVVEQELAGQKITTLEGKISVLRTQISDERGKIAKIEARPEWQTLSFKKASTENTLTNLQNQKATSESRISVLKNQIYSLEVEIANLNKQVTTNINTKSDINEELPELHKTAASLRTTISQLNVQISDLKDDKRDVQVSINNANSQISSLESALSDLETAKDSVVDQLTTIQTTLDQAPSLREEKRDIENHKLPDVTIKLSKRESALETNRSNLETLKSEKQTAQTNLNTINAQIANLESQKGQVPPALAGKQAELTQLKELYALLPSLTTEKQTLETQLTDLNTQKETLAAEVQALVEKKKAQGQLEKSDRQELRKKSKILKAIPKKIEKVQSALTQLINNKYNPAVAAGSKIAQLEAEIAEISGSVPDNDTIQAQIDALIPGKVAAQSIINLKNTEINSTKTAIKGLKKNVSDLKNKKSTLQARLTELKTTISTFPQLKQSKKSLVKQNQQLAIQIERVESNLSTYRSQRKSLRQTKRNLSSQITSLETNRDTLQTNLNSLDWQIQSKYSQLESIESTLKSLNSQIVISERQLTADINELVQNETTLAQVNAQLPGAQSAFDLASSNYDSYYSIHQQPHVDLISGYKSNIRTHQFNIVKYENLIEDLNEHEGIIAQSTQDILELEERQEELGPLMEQQIIVYQEAKSVHDTAKSKYDKDLVRMDRLRNDYSFKKSEVKKIKSGLDSTYSKIK